MTYMKKALVLSVLVTLISVLGFEDYPNAMALASTVHDQISCEAPSVGGVWNSIISICTVTTLVIGPADNLVVASNVVFNIGTVTSSDSIVNWETISDDEFIIELNCMQSPNRCYIQVAV